MKKLAAVRSKFNGVPVGYQNLFMLGTHTHTHTYIYIYIYIYTYKHICLRNLICTYNSIYISTYVHTQKGAYIFFRGEATSQLAPRFWGGAQLDTARRIPLNE